AGLQLAVGRRIDELLRTELRHLKALIDELKEKLQHPEIREVVVRRMAEVESDKDRRRIAVCLMDQDESILQSLAGQLLEVGLPEFRLLSRALERHMSKLADRYWEALDNPGRPSTRLRAAAALGLYFPDDLRWTPVRLKVVARLLSSDPGVEVGGWIK